MGSKLHTPGAQLLIAAALATPLTLTLSVTVNDVFDKETLKNEGLIEEVNGQLNLTSAGVEILDRKSRPDDFDDDNEDPESFHVSTPWGETTFTLDSLLMDAALDWA